MSSLRIERLTRPGVSAAGLTVAAGSCTAVFGPSGSGKTLLLRAIADLDPNTAVVRLGELDRAAMPAHRWRALVCYVPAEALWWAERVGEHASAWQPAHLQALGFEPDVLGWDVKRLSSGERQRLGVARALTLQPGALLLDEPTANLDDTNTLCVERLVADYQGQHQAPVVWVSHDIAQRDRVARQVREIRAGRLL